MKAMSKQESVSFGAYIKSLGVGDLSQDDLIKAKRIIEYKFEGVRRVVPWDVARRFDCLPNIVTLCNCLSYMRRRIGEENFGLMCRSEYVCNIEVLLVDFCELSFERVENNFGGLKRLRATGNNISAAGVERIGAVGLLASVDNLYLGGNDLGDDLFVEILGILDGYSEVVFCDFSRNCIALEKACVLSGISLNSMTGLKLDGNPLGDGGLIHLLTSVALPELRFFSLFNCGIGVDFMRFLSGWHGLHRLESLWFNHEEVGVEGLEILVDSDSLNPVLRETFRKTLEQLRM